jgi:hypothetical protein
LPFHQDEITTAVFKARIEQAVFKFLFVSEKKETLRIHVETTHGKAAGRKGKFSQGALVLLSRIGVELAENPVGFVEGEEHDFD